MHMKITNKQIDALIAENVRSKRLLNPGKWEIFTAPLNDPFEAPEGGPELDIFGKRVKD